MRLRKLCWGIYGVSTMEDKGLFGFKRDEDFVSKKLLRDVRFGELFLRG